MSHYQVKLKKSFNISKQHSFDLDVAFKIPHGKITALFGPSGAGKSTLLRLLAGLESPDTGSIYNGDEQWSSVHPWERSIGYLFQDLALFPHMSVLDNLCYAQKKVGNRDVGISILKRMGIEQFKNSYPHELSGGQRQRVALARAVIGKPSLLLLDEPFSALDSEMKSQLQQDLLLWHRELQCTVVIVSHEMVDLFRLVDHVIKLKEGKIEEEGSLNEIFLKRQMSARIQLPVKVLKKESDCIHTLLTVKDDRHHFSVFVDNELAQQINIGDEVMVAIKSSEAWVKI